MNQGIHIVAILGSVRPENFTSKALALVIDEFKIYKDITLEVIDPSTMNLPIPGRDGNSADMNKLKKAVSKATGVVLSTPEYHGSFSSVIKLVIENLGFPSVLSGKPVTLLGVAAGQIGAIKALEHLRSVCSHIGAIVLPGPVSVAEVQKLFDEQGRCVDEATEKRIRGVATNLIKYIQANICPRIALEQMVRSGSC
ncbi:MAG: NADPH-dependent FMN reductase [bacterium]